MTTTITVTRPTESASTALINALSRWLTPIEGEAYSQWEERYDAAVSLCATDLDAPDLIDRLERATDPISQSTSNKPADHCPDCDEAFYQEDDRIIRTECFHCGWDVHYPTPA